jgi:hypothetical protein
MELPEANGYNTVMVVVTELGKISNVMYLKRDVLPPAPERDFRTSRGSETYDQWLVDD